MDTTTGRVTITYPSLNDDSLDARLECENICENMENVKKVIKCKGVLPLYLGQDMPGNCEKHGPEFVSTTCTLCRTEAEREFNF